MENYLSEPRPEFTRALLRVRGVAVTARHVRTRRAGDGGVIRLGGSVLMVNSPARRDGQSSR